MKMFIIAIATVSAICAPAATTINSANRFAYGANIGWIDWRGDINNGAVIGAFVCSGHVWAANVGWISLGNGPPASGIRYQNNSASDFGVNHDGMGNLSGFAYGADIGWINFTNRDAFGAAFAGPRIDLVTGRLSGFVWSANCGWISLSNVFAHVQTDTMDCGPDTDGDGIPDMWERQFSANLATLNGSGDNDNDGLSNVQEFLADTNPLDPNSLLKITLFTAGAGGSPANLTWSNAETRQYRVRASTDVAAPQPWPEAGLGLIVPDAGDSTTRSVTGPMSQRFFIVEALKPLAP